MAKLAAIFAKCHRRRDPDMLRSPPDAGNTPSWGTGLYWLRAGRDPAVFNLGTGHGFSVAEVLVACPTAIGHAVPHVTGPRRTGDVAALVSGSRRAARDLGWQTQHSTLEQMIRDAWRWYQTGGYSG